MYHNKKIMALIPARGGSKRIKNKNLKKINAISLVEHSIHHAKSTKLIDEIYVSTENLRTKKLCQNLKINVLNREKKLSQDSSTIFQVIEDIIKKQYVKDMKEKFNFDLIVVLQPTTPFRSKQTINKAIKLFIDNLNKNYTDLMPLKQVSPKVGLIKKAIYYPYIKEETPIQKLENLYKECGTIFIYRKDFFLKNPPQRKILPFIVKNEKETIDIDNQEDFKKIESLTKYTG